MPSGQKLLERHIKKPHEMTIEERLGLIDLLLSLKRLSIDDIFEREEGSPYYKLPMR